LRLHDPGVETDQRPGTKGPYYPALSHPVLRRVSPGAAASALATVALALVTAAILAARRRSPQPGPFRLSRLGDASQSSGKSRATTATGAASGGRAAARSSRCRYWAISARITSVIPAISSGVR
jgi:hypothetical protein